MHQSKKEIAFAPPLGWKQATDVDQLDTTDILEVPPHLLVQYQTHVLSSFG
jgi:hypothetical protein